MFGNGRLFAIHTDHLGTPRLMTNDVNKPVWQWPYSAFGTTRPTGVLKATARPKNAKTNQPVMLKGTVPAQVLNLRDPGQYEDPETGLRDNINRMLSANTGRYTQSDPIGTRGGPNRFLYVGGNPLSFIDPLGLEAGVTVWQPTGWGSSSFGHVSTNINGTTYSFGPNGMTTMPTSEYNKRNDFRHGTEIILNLSPQQEAALQACLSKPQGEYGAATKNCGSPVQDCLKSLGINTGNKLFPADLGNKLIDLGLPKGVREYPASRSANGSRAPWAR